jgi:hypothetical protein
MLSQVCSVLTRVRFGSQRFVGVRGASLVFVGVRWHSAQLLLVHLPANTRT